MSRDKVRKDILIMAEADIIRRNGDRLRRSEIIRLETACMRRWMMGTGL